jgi:GMP synthase (glutamine-hydrolysing)
MAADSSSILYVIHKRDWDKGRVADAVAAAGYRVAYCCPPDGEALPEDPAGFAGVVLGGGLDSVNEAGRRPYLAQEVLWTRQAVQSGARVFGICLGAQMLAAAYGGRTAPHPDGQVEYGFYRIRPTPAGRPWFGGLTHVFQSHFESVVELPPEAELLATGDTFRTQAFRIGTRAFGVQFHPDARLDMLAAWCDGCAPHLVEPGAQSRADQLRLAPRYEAAIQSWLEGFVARWLGSGEARRLSARPARVSSGRG